MNKKVFITDPRIAVKKGIALIMGKNEGDSLFPEFSIGDNITFPVLGRTSKFGFRNKKFEAIIENESIKGVNFSDNMKDKLIIELSGGQKQKVLLAKSIAMNCKIYVINNAMANVDYITRIALYNKLFELRSEGKAILFFSRDYEELKMISDRIYVTKNNTVVEEY